MAWTRSQDDLRERIAAPVASGLATVLVFAEYCSGCTRLLLSLVRESAQAAGPRVIAVTGVYGDWDIIALLSRAAKTTGRAQSDQLLNALQVLSANSARPVVIVVEDAHFMTTRQMEAFTLCLEHAAAKLNVKTRVVLLFKKARYWRRCVEKGQDGALYTGNTWESVVDFPPLPLLFQEREKAKALTVCELKREGLEALSRKAAREEIGERVALAS
jgi:hypothetical protein